MARLWRVRIRYSRRAPLQCLVVNSPGFIRSGGEPPTTTRPMTRQRYRAQSRPPVQVAQKAEQSNSLEGQDTNLQTPVHRPSPYPAMAWPLRVLVITLKTHLRCPP